MKHGTGVIDKRGMLFDDGYCVFENVLDKQSVKSVAEAVDRAIQLQPAEHFEKD